MRWRRVHHLGSLQNTNININTNIKSLFKTSHAALILNELFTFLFMWPFTLIFANSLLFLQVQPKSERNIVFVLSLIANS